MHNRHNGKHVKQSKEVLIEVIRDCLVDRDVGITELRWNEIEGGHLRVVNSGVTIRLSKNIERACASIRNWAKRLPARVET